MAKLHKTPYALATELNSTAVIKIESEPTGIHLFLCLIFAVGGYGYSSY